MALSSVFTTIEKAYGAIIKGAFEEAKKQGAGNTEALYYMMTTTGKVLFDIKDRQSVEDTLLKIGGDVVQGIILKLVIRNGKLAAAIDVGLISSGYSLGNLLLYIKDASQISFSQGYIYKPGGISIANTGTFLKGPYFRVETVTLPDGTTQIYRDPVTNQIMSAEEISQSMYESVHPNYVDLYQYELKWSEINDTVNSFNADITLSYENGVMSVEFPDGHIEAKDLENINNTIYGDANNDSLYGMGGQDAIFGGLGGDTLDGGTGDDLLIGGDQTSYYDNDSDRLEGGADYDVYLVAGGDTIYDSDGSGMVLFRDLDLRGSKTLQANSQNIFEDENFTYEQVNGNLKVTSKHNYEIVTIEGWKDGDLGITLEDGEIRIYIEDAAPVDEGEQAIFYVVVEGNVDENFTIELSTFGDTATPNDDYIPNQNIVVGVGSGNYSNGNSFRWPVAIQTKTDQDDNEGPESFDLVITNDTYSGDSNIVYVKDEGTPLIVTLCSFGSP